MNLLLVDDEEISIRGIKALADFPKYGIDQVYSANSMQQAISVLEKEDVDIVVSDVEMPNGSGLDLISWMNDNTPGIVSIILTCHSDFSFARQAISLRCYEYLLKPVTAAVLEKVLTGAVAEVNRYREGDRIREYADQYVRQMAGEKEKTEDPDDIVGAVSRYIREHVEEDLSVEQLCSIAYISHNHLTRLFKKAYNQTVIEYIQSYRVDLAKHMLSDTDQTITAISSRVGYPNYAYFTRLFKAYTGVTPTAYRSKCLKKKPE